MVPRSPAACKNLAETQIFSPHARPAESETLEVRPSDLDPPGDSNACSNLRPNGAHNLKVPSAGSLKSM